MESRLGVCPPKLKYNPCKLSKIENLGLYLKQEEKSFFHEQMNMTFINDHRKGAETPMPHKKFIKNFTKFTS